MDNKIGAVMVLYRPDIEQTLKAAESIAAQVDELCIVDNTPGVAQGDVFAGIPSVTYIHLGDNRGLAAAQNVGINYLQSRKTDYILFSDQDSQPPSDMVSRLLKAYRDLEDAGVKVATVGPMPRQRTTGKPTFDKWNLRFKKSIGGREVMCMDYIISSGSLMRTSVLESVGPMLESLFIDGIDSEWCWRAAHFHGLQSFIIPDITMTHMMGEDTGERRSIRIPTPFRVYYQFRNYFRLLYYPQTPTWWKVKNGIKYTVKAVYYPLFLKPRGQFVKRIAAGVRDGLKTSGQ
ncbi:MAG: glycosyltransferase family 2 protein [Muribaculaceae bacterium]|nr:glycosyltransferase family 2 protein [Muribaculaceae bacterium]